MIARVVDGETPQLDLEGKVLTVQALKSIAIALENHGAVVVKGVSTTNGQPVADWLGLVLQNLKTRRTDGPTKGNDPQSAAD